MLKLPKDLSEYASVRNVNELEQMLRFFEMWNYFLKGKKFKAILSKDIYIEIFKEDRVYIYTVRKDELEEKGKVEFKISFIKELRKKLRKVGYKAYSQK